MKPVTFLLLTFFALSVFSERTAFAEGLGYKCSSSHEIVKSLKGEEICSDLDITDKVKLSTCLQRKYISVKNNLDSTYANLVTAPNKGKNTVLEGNDESDIRSLLGFFKNKPVEIRGFVEEKNHDTFGQDSKKRDELIKEQTAWNENLLYGCMDAANAVENDPYPLLVIKGCLVNMTEERIAYLNKLL